MSIPAGTLEPALSLSRLHVSFHPHTVTSTLMFHRIHHHPLPSSAPTHLRLDLHRHNLTAPPAPPLSTVSSPLLAKPAAVPASCALGSL
ncbi:hypothetical protein BC567DRAFT_220568 [Phyllosticta citribraziliensis]